MDWSLVFQICDVVNNTDLGAKEARKLLQKKMLSSEAQTQILALELLDALSQNCQEKFRTQLSAKSFGEDLDILATQKSTNDKVHSKLVHCLQNWMSRYGADPSFAGIQRVYDKIMNGVPGTKHTTGTRFKMGPQQQQSQHLLEHEHIQRIRQDQARRAQQQSSDPMNDVLLAKNNAQLFLQTLAFTDPTQEDIASNDLIKEFYGKCKMFQKIIAKYLETCEDPDINTSLLEANTELVNAFKAYDDMVERRALTEATINSEVLHDRSTRQQRELQKHRTEGTDLIGIQSSASGSSITKREDNPKDLFGEESGSDGLYHHRPSQQQLQQPTQPVFSDDPFDPFADTNETKESLSSENAG
ncbi:hypothetical protein BX666DRAFT_1904387 [Dichotomocladium elegans]|nr:hypothetical protein BX666DRAFT_1904387 [Dichotomocladium elegans]